MKTTLLQIDASEIQECIPIDSGIKPQESRVSHKLESDLNSKDQNMIPRSERSKFESKLNSSDHQADPSSSEAQ